jgi:hypothetical protein
MRTLVAAVLALAAAPVLAQQNGLPEGLGSPALAGFIVGNRASNENQFILEEIPEGETVHSWTRMVSTQRYRDLALKASPYQMLQSIAASTPKSCPGAIVTAPASLKIGGRDAARMRVECPLNPQSGTPETFLMLVVAGQRDMMLKQVAFRGRTSGEDIAWATGFLGSVTVCTSPDPASCKR